MKLKVGDFVEVLRNAWLIQQCKVSEIATRETSRGKTYEVSIEYGDGFGETYYVSGKKWTTVRSGFHTSHDPDPGYEPDTYEEESKDDFRPNKDGALRKKHPHLDYHSYANSVAFHQEYEKWRKAYQAKNGRWPYGTDDLKKHDELKKKHFGV